MLLDGEQPSVVDIDVTGGHIERLARSLHGGAGHGELLLVIGNHSYYVMDPTVLGLGMQLLLLLV